MSVNLAEVATILGGATSAPLVMAAIREMPEDLPRTLNAWWQFVRATLQQYLSIKGLERPNPIPPQEGA